MKSNECVLIIILAAMAVTFLLAFQVACIEWNLNNDAFYLEKMRIEEAN
jgi:hypothetical protein